MIPIAMDAVGEEAIFQQEAIPEIIIEMKITLSMEGLVKERIAMQLSSQVGAKDSNRIHSSSHQEAIEVL